MSIYLVVLLVAVALCAGFLAGRRYERDAGPPGQDGGRRKRVSSDRRPVVR